MHVFCLLLCLLACCYEQLTDGLSARKPDIDWGKVYIRMVGSVFSSLENTGRVMFPSLPAGESCVVRRELNSLTRLRLKFATSPWTRDEAVEWAGRMIIWSVHGSQAACYEGGCYTFVKIDLELPPPQPVQPARYDVCLIVV